MGAETHCTASTKWADKMEDDLQEIQDEISDVEGELGEAEAEVRRLKHVLRELNDKRYAIEDAILAKAWEEERSNDA